MIDGNYFRDVVSALEKALYYERGRGAFFRATMVGNDFIDRKKIEGQTPEEVIENCMKAMIEENVIKKGRFVKDEKGTLFTFEMEGCAHLPVEARLKQEGVPAYICPPTNIILHKVRERLDLAVEIADITVNQEEGKCITRVVVFKQE